MKQILLLVILLTHSTTYFAQKKVVGQVDSVRPNCIQLKWYFPGLINEEGYNVYRKSKNENWKKLNEVPLKFKHYQPSVQEFQIDTELKSYLDLLGNQVYLKDLSLLACVLKSFKSEAFSKYLGIFFEDTKTNRNQSYWYKVTGIKNNFEVDSAFSEEINSGNFSAIDAPKSFTLNQKDKIVSISWLPEPQRYYAVNIFRKGEMDSGFYCINNHEIILSKIKDKNGAEAYGEKFYEDSKLKAKQSYTYHLQALDFFGNPSHLSAPLIIKIKDTDAPKAPDSLYYTLNGRRVKLYWRKKQKEDDLFGYNIYRTTNNDTDFVKLNKQVILSPDSFYIDSVARFGSYMYAVSSMDGDSNEQVSNPFFVEVYDNEAPLIPKNLKISSDTGKIKIVWDKNTEEDLKGYLVYRTINKNSGETFVKITPSPIPENYFEDELAKNIKNKFIYKVLAVDGSLNRSAYSECVSVQLPDVTAPLAPFMYSISISENNYVELRWFANAEPDLAGYKLYRKNLIDTNSSFQQLAKKIIPADLQLFTDRTIQENGIYAYKLTAIDSSGNESVFSNGLKKSVKMNSDKGTISVTKFNVKYNQKRNQTEVNWKLSNDKNLKTCMVYRIKKGDINLTPCSGLVNECHFIDNDLQKGSEYSYQLRIYNATGDVIKSELKSVLTQ